ncbi:MAG: gamma-glutamyltransferase [Gammaproteobacteria bacterium]|nr:gamma-glutamyltransferase [Gammaproteobacteria bacterium]
MNFSCAIVKARFGTRIWAALALSLTLWAGGPLAEAQQQSLLEYPSIHSPRVGLQGMVVSQNETASAIGAKVLAEGGNAIDAAVAVGFALAVTLPRAGNIGGDGFMTAYLANEKKVTVIDFRSVAPLTAKLDMFVDARGKERPEASVGYRAAAVPGTVAGLWMAHQKYGLNHWGKLVAPATALARDGLVLSTDEAFVFDWGRKRLEASATAKAAFFKADGGAFKAGECLQQPQLAWTLEQVAKGGAEAFYRGEVATRIEADMRRNGGLITREDLAAYRAIERTPLVGTYRGTTVYTPPPASGGAALLLMLNILENFDLSRMSAGSAESLHLLAETMRLGHRDRVRHFGDTAFADVPLTGITSKAYAAERSKLINTRQANDDDDIRAGDPFAYESQSTTHYSVADRFGNVVSVTYTLGSDFGSGAMIDGTGILLNNQMNNFSHEREFRAAESNDPEPVNAMRPGKRMMSTMMPTLVFRDGKPWLALGTPGGGRIINTVLQVLVNVVDFRLNIDEATHQARISQGDGPLEVEPNFNPDTLELLRKKGHRIKRSDTMGSAQSIALENGYFFGAPDPRRPGAAAIAP